MKMKLLSVILIMLCLITACGNIAEQDNIEESIEISTKESGMPKTYCSIRGTVESEGTGEGVKGHTPGTKSYWPKVEGPTCTGGAYYNISCTVCGEHLESGTDPALPHTEVGTEVWHGNCRDLTVISYDCSTCGHHIRNESYTIEDHDWAFGEADYFNEETLEWEKVAITYCTRCNSRQ